MSKKAALLRLEGRIPDPDPERETSIFGMEAEQSLAFQKEFSNQQLKVVEMERKLELINSLRPDEFMQVLRVLGIEDLSEWPDALAVDDQHVYCACGPTPSLVAYALSDGTPVWRRHLIGPETGWSVVLAEGVVAAYPSPDRSAAGELPDLPLVFCRREDGQLVQRLVFSAPVSQLAVQLARGSSLIATQGRGWALGPRGAVDEAGPPE